MHKRLLGAALAMSALLAGSQASQPAPSTATDNAPVEGKTVSVSVTVAGRTAPVKSVSFANQPEKTVVTVKARPLAALSPMRFIERSGRRKVKYGKCRWVLLS
ncbi:MAG: hypothetical protein ACRYFV_20590 [Janthinobacterium lividum]